MLPRNDLFSHMHWADASVWRYILEMPALETDARLRELLHHIHLVQHAFLGIWTKQKLDLPEVSSFEDLLAISKWAQTYPTKVTAYLDQISDSHLQDIVQIPWSNMVEQKLGKAPEPTTLGETMLQVASHTMHHRGQVTARLRELGGEPPLIDFIAWVWFGKPQAEWPERIQG